MCGEEHHGDDYVWCTKTHHPASGGNNKHFEDKIINISRNPIDVAPSFPTLLLTASHPLVPVKPWNEYTDYWNFIAGFVARGMESFNKIILE